MFGKHYYALAAEKTKRNLKDTAIVRVEELSPFPADDLRKCVKNVGILLWAALRQAGIDFPHTKSSHTYKHTHTLCWIYVIPSLCTYVSLSLPLCVCVCLSLSVPLSLYPSIPLYERVEIPLFLEENPFSFPYLLWLFANCLKAKFFAKIITCLLNFFNVRLADFAVYLRSDLSQGALIMPQ